MENVTKTLQAVDEFITANKSNKKDELINAVLSVNKCVETALQAVGEYTEIMDYGVLIKDCSETDNHGNYNRTIYEFEYENGHFKQSLSLSGGSDCWNTYQGRYLDVLNNEELITLIDKMASILKEALEILKECKENEMHYEKEINKILFKNDFKKLCRLSKEYCIII